MKFYLYKLENVVFSALFLVLATCAMGCWNRAVVSVQYCKERGLDDYCKDCDSLITYSHQYPKKGTYMMRSHYYQNGQIAVKTKNIYKKKAFYNQPLYEKVEFFRNGQFYKSEEVITKDTIR